MSICNVCDEKGRILFEATNVELQHVTEEKMREILLGYNQLIVFNKKNDESLRILYGEFARSSEEADKKAILERIKARKKEIESELMDYYKGNK